MPQNKNKATRPFAFTPASASALPPPPLFLPQVPSGLPLLVLGQEILDALPIHQFEFTPKVEEDGGGGRRKKEEEVEVERAEAALEPHALVPLHSPLRLAPLPRFCFFVCLFPLLLSMISRCMWRPCCCQGWRERLVGLGRRLATAG